MTLDGGTMFDAGKPPYKLRPVAAEVYGTKEREFFFLGTLKPRDCVVAMEQFLWSRNGRANEANLVSVSPWGTESLDSDG